MLNFLQSELEVERLYIVSASPEKAAGFQQMMTLRDFDSVRVLSYGQFTVQKYTLSSGVFLWDWEGSLSAVATYLQALPVGCKSIVLTASFDEPGFVACHDAGARDVLLKPVVEAYLVSRILLAFKEFRLEQALRQQASMLIDLGGISRQSGLLSHTYFLKKLAQMQEKACAGKIRQLSLVVLESDLLLSNESLIASVAQVIKTSMRGLDLAGELGEQRFGMLLPDTSVVGANALKRRLHKNLEQLSVQQHQSPLGRVQWKIGVASYEADSAGMDLLQQASKNIANT